MDIVPSELVLHIVQYLNPVDRWRLSATHRHLRDLLPVWLRIRIASPSSRSSLKDHFYVSPAQAQDQPLLFYPQDITDALLQYGIEYVFWTYDYERENPVFLGRHGQKLLNPDDPQCLYTLGLRPTHPNQTWTVVKKTNFDGSDSEAEAHGEIVPYGKSICLTVGGQHPNPCRPDSSNRLYLSAHKLLTGALWYAVHDKEWSMDEELHLLRSVDCLESSGHSKIGSKSFLHSKHSGRWGNHVKDDKTLSERDLIIHAIPEIMDGCYSLYSPESLKQGQATCALHHTTIPCYYWIQDGQLLFHAFEALKFTFAVPILEEDQVDHKGCQTEPLSVLLTKNSSRWWAIKYYISTAADVEEGRTFQMETFLRNSKDHEDHTILFDEEKKAVQITVQDAIVDKKFPNVARDDHAIWIFLLSG